MKIRNITNTIAVVATVLLFSFSVITLNTISAKADQAALVNLVIEESQTVSAFEYETVLLAEMLYGEGKGHLNDWPHMVSASFNRVEDRRWPDNIVGVLLKTRPNGRGCEIDAMCDSLMENLTSERGQLALEYAAASLRDFYAGTFAFSHTGHSWATPAAAVGHDYFEGLVLVAEGTGHLYFADAPVRPRARPECLMGCAPKISIRPIARPTVPQDPVLLALLEAN